MSVMRIYKTRNYTVVSNVYLCDKRMSLKAKGLLTLMLSLPDDWDYSVAGLTVICKESKTAIQTTLRELEQFCYLKRTKERNQKGQFECIYEIFEVPQENHNQSDISPEQNHGFDDSTEFCPSVAEEPQHNIHSVKSVSENQSRTTYKQNTEYQVQKQNTEKKKIYLAVIAHLNEVTGASYRAETRRTQLLMEERLREGYQLEDFVKVIDRKHREWAWTEFAQYLRPSTLFGDKFEGYLNAPETPSKKAKSSAPPPDMSDIVPGIF